MIYHGDLFDVLPTLDAESVDAVVTDPPYGLEFMGKAWDSFGRERNYAPRSDKGYGHKGVVPGYGRGGTSEDRDRFKRKANLSFQVWTERWAAEVFRVLKPGAHVVVFGGTRTFHRLTAGIEDAGFEIRDCLSWLYGQGFPKSLNVGDGRGTALKPAWEPIILARKPTTGTVAANVQRFGTGALNVDACRIGTTKDVPASVPKPGTREGQGIYGKFGDLDGTEDGFNPNVGRWPSNVLLDEDAAALLDEQTGELCKPGNRLDREYASGEGANVKFNNGGLMLPGSAFNFGDSGGASRFFYVAKPDRAERDLGTEHLTARARDESRKDGNPGGDNPRNRGLQPRGNFHPTVKPIALMRWLVRLVTPINGTVIDPFMGSGTTGIACRFEGREFIGIEREADYIQIAEARIAAVLPLFSAEVSA